MQKFWYHSPVRFYRTIEELEDMTNPQNTQYFGDVRNPYPLEIGEYHRFLIPMIDNDVPSDDLELWIGDVQISAKFHVVADKLERVTFMHGEYISGQFEIRRNDDVLFYSNCVKFIDSSDGAGRKFIRIATKHYYNKVLFNFEDDNNWIVTNLPAYCLGQFRVDAEISNYRAGGNSTLKSKESHLDEIVSYEFLTHGDANILAFLQVHSTNTEFYIDGTKRTLTEKITVDDLGVNGVVNFTNQKDIIGTNMLLNEDGIFDDFFRYEHDFAVDGIGLWSINGGTVTPQAEGILIETDTVGDGVFRFLPLVEAGKNYSISIWTKAAFQTVTQATIGFNGGETEVISISTDGSAFVKTSVTVTANGDGDAVIVYSAETGENDFILNKITIQEIL